MVNSHTPSNGHLTIKDKTFGPSGVCYRGALLFIDYIDYILVTGATEEKHLLALKAVLAHLENANLRARKKSAPLWYQLLTILAIG